MFYSLRPLLIFKGVNYYYIKTVKYFPLYIMRQLAHAYHEFFRVNPKNKGSTPLHASAWIGNEVVVKHILNKMDGRKMSYNPKDTTEWTPLHWAAFNGHDSICGMIRVSNSDIKFRNSEIEFQYRFRNSKLVNSDIF